MNIKLIKLKFQGDFYSKKNIMEKYMIMKVTYYLKLSMIMQLLNIIMKI